MLFRFQPEIQSDHKYNGLLEKKWTSIVRLQKKVGCGSDDSDVYLITDSDFAEHGIGEQVAGVGERNEARCPDTGAKKARRLDPKGPRASLFDRTPSFRSSSDISSQIQSTCIRFRGCDDKSAQTFNRL